ncbi:MAG: hypothetical protein U9R47_00765, partial [Actinomycetota bacterium]|nr:hypothetical protein [Actinomycetota bacterium]
MEPSRRERASIWGGLRSGIGNRLTGFLRRRMVPILVGVAVLVGFFFVTTGASLPDDGEPIPISADDALVFARNLADAAGDVPGTRAVDLTV